MNRHPRSLIAPLILALAAGPGSVASEKDEVYYCEDADGNVILQMDPCPAPVVEEPDVPVPPAVAPPAVAPRVVKPRPVVVPAPLPTPSPPPARRSTSGWTLVPRAWRPALESRSAVASQEFPVRLDAEASVQAPSFSSPEATWRTFVAAITREDANAARSCLTPAALERLGSDDGSIWPQDLRSMLDGLTRIENGGNVGPFWSIRGIREDRRPKWIFFEQTEAGEWKIAGI
jgi:hypothetical protein